MTQELGHLLDDKGFAGPSYRVRCFAHSLNLVVKVCFCGARLHVKSNKLCQAILSQFAQQRMESDDNAENSEDDALLDRLAEPADEEDEAAMQDKDADREASNMVVIAELDDELEYDTMLSRDDINLGRFAIHKACYCPAWRNTY
jgi:hypothetical protein